MYNYAIHQNLINVLSHLRFTIRYNATIIYYWEYKLIQFLCISKRNKWTDQLKYCPSLPTTFSSLRQFSNSISKNDSSLEAIQFWSQFSISAKEVKRCFAAFGTTSNQKEQCLENTVGAVKYSIWAFKKNIFLRL